MLATAQQTISISTSAASIAVPALATAHVLPAAAAGPIGLAVAGVALALTAILSRKGPKQKVISTQIVNELEPQLQANLAGYMDTRTPASRAQALANFQAAWQFLASSQACGSPDLGNPGRACIADRGRGGKWDWWNSCRECAIAAPGIPP